MSAKIKSWGIINDENFPKTRCAYCGLEVTLNNFLVRTKRFNISKNRLKCPRCEKTGKRFGEKGHIMQRIESPLELAYDDREDISYEDFDTEPPFEDGENYDEYDDY